MQVSIIRSIFWDFATTMARELTRTQKKEPTGYSRPLSRRTNRLGTGSTSMRKKIITSWSTSG